MESIVLEHETKIVKLQEEIKQKTQFYQETLEHLLEKERKFEESEFGFTEQTRLSKDLTESFEKSKKEVQDKLHNFL